MKVVIIASEAVPFAKTGGLADVAGALPRALADLGHEATLFLPLHRSASRSGVSLTPTGHRFLVPVGSREVEARIVEARLPGSAARAFLIEQPAYFNRDDLYGPYGVDYPDNCERFTFFCRAVLEGIGLLALRPDVLHCNDWHTGLIPILLSEPFLVSPAFRPVGTLLTIHNLAYQGTFDRRDMPLTRLDWGRFHAHHVDFEGQLNFLKAGIAFADLLNTVSPTYAREIQTPEFGFGLDGLLSARSGDLHGIVNGIDTSIWNPATDPRIAANYDVETWHPGKAACKIHLQRELGLPVRPDVPLFAQIGRLDPQKGWDLLASIADDFLVGDVQMVVLGEGHPRYHELLERLSGRHPGKIRAVLRFDPKLAHRIEAGADLLLMPSLYEPCGLNQLYSLAYGTVPIVRATGGLADTVVDVTPESLKSGTATGFTFDEPTPESFLGAIRRALVLWPDMAARGRLVRDGMRADWSWRHSALDYVGLYEEIRERRAGRLSG